MGVVQGVPEARIRARELYDAITQKLGDRKGWQIYQAELKEAFYLNKVYGRGSAGNNPACGACRIKAYRWLLKFANGN